MELQFEDNEPNLITNEPKKGPNTGSREQKTLRQSNFLRITLEFLVQKIYVELSLN